MAASLSAFFFEPPALENTLYAGYADSLVVTGDYSSVIFEFLTAYIFLGNEIITVDLGETVDSDVTCEAYFLDDIINEVPTPSSDSSRRILDDTTCIYSYSSYF